jgi:hypothetical protein
MLALFTIALFASAAQAPQGRPFAEERQILDRHLAALAKALPDAATPVEDATLVQQIAMEAGLRNVEVGPPTVTESGTLGQSHRSFAANATFPDTDRFFRALQTSQRLIDVESVSLRVADFGVKVEARLRFHHRAARAVATASLDPARARDRTRGATKEQTTKFARDEQLALEKSIALDDLRRKQTSPRLFLAETGSVFRDSVAALTFGSIDADTGRFSLRGVVAGMGAADALERRLEGGFFRIREFSRTPKAGCYQFEAVGESFRAGPEAALALPVDEPFRGTEGFCRQDRDAMLLGSPGALLRAGGNEPGGISLRAIDTDLVDIAAMIETISREPFVIAEGVRGRVNVELVGVSVDDALKAVPLRVQKVGAVRLLRPSSGPVTEVAEPGDAPPASRISFRAKRARGDDAIAAIAETDPSFATFGPSPLASVSVFAREAPADEVRRAVLAALGLTENRDDGRRVVRNGDAAQDPKPITAAGSPRFVFRARDLTVDELALAGIGRSGDESIAFVYSPLGEIVALRAGDTLADGVVASVDAGAMLVDSSEGPVRVSLAAVRPR